MQWNDHAIVLATKKYGENKILAHVFSRMQGAHAGMVSGAFSKSNRGTMHAGNVVNVHWQARLPEQIGTFRAELATPFASLIMQDAEKLAALSSACAMLEVSLPERHPYPRLYDALLNFLQLLSDSSHWQQDYVQLELEILSQCGFGLDLSRCAGTGTTSGLIYVSPKSGRAVCAEAGEPYKDKLLPLPEFLLPSSTSTEGVERNNACEETLAGMRLTGYFLEHWLVSPHGKKMPAARQWLIQLMKETHVEEAPT